MIQQFTNRVLKITKSLIDPRLCLAIARTSNTYDAVISVDEVLLAVAHAWVSMTAIEEQHTAVSSLIEAVLNKPPAGLECRHRYRFRSSETRAKIGPIYLLRASGRSLTKN